MTGIHQHSGAMAWLGKAAAFFALLLALLAIEMSRPPRRTLLLIQVPPGAQTSAAFGHGINVLPTVLQQHLCAPPFRRQAAAEATPLPDWNVALVLCGGLGDWARNPQYVLEEALDGAPVRGFLYGEFDAVDGCGAYAAHLGSWRWRLGGAALYGGEDDAVVEVQLGSSAAGTASSAAAEGCRKLAAAQVSLLLPSPAPLVLAGKVLDSNAGFSYVQLFLGVGREGALAVSPSAATSSQQVLRTRLEPIVP